MGFRDGQEERNCNQVAPARRRMVFRDCQEEKHCNQGIPASRIGWAETPAVVFEGGLEDKGVALGSRMLCLPMRR